MICVSHLPGESERHPGFFLDVCVYPLMQFKNIEGLSERGYIVISRHPGSRRKREAKGPFKREIGRVNFFSITSSLKKVVFLFNWSVCLSQSFRYLTPNRTKMLHRVFISHQGDQCIFCWFVECLWPWFPQARPAAHLADQNGCEGGVLPVVI